MKLRYIAIVIAITAMLLLVGCGKKEAPAPEPTPAPTPAPAPAQAPEPEPESEPVVEETAEPEEVVLEEGGDVTEEAEEKKEATGLAADLTTEATAFPQASCELKEVDGKEKRVISVKIKNVEDDDWEIYGKENPKGKVRIGNRGVIHILPGCEKMTLAPGESTLCTTIDMGVIEGENRVTVNTPIDQYARIVDCP